MGGWQLTNPQITIREKRKKMLAENIICEFMIYIVEITPNIGNQ